MGMFFKYASNVLQEISDECMLKSVMCKDSKEAYRYRNIARRIDHVINRIAVEERIKPRLK